MEKTMSIYVASLQEQWELPDSLAVKWEEYEKEHEGEGADSLHREWLNSLSSEEQKQIIRQKRAAE